MILKKKNLRIYKYATKKLLCDVSHKKNFVYFMMFIRILSFFYLFNIFYLNFDIFMTKLCRVQKCIYLLCKNS